MSKLINSNSPSNYKSFKYSENIPDWHQQMAELVGLEEIELPNEQTGELVAINNQEETSLIQPQPEKTSKSLSANPFAKVALVGATTLTAVLVAGAFLSQIMNGTSKQPKNIVEQHRKPSNISQIEEVKPETEIEVLKTKLALAEQAMAIKSAQIQLKSLQPPQPPQSSQPPQPSPAKANSTPITQPKTVTRVVVQKVPTPAPTVYIPKIVTVERVVKVPQVIAQTKPTAISPQPVVSPAKFQPSMTSLITPVKPQPVIPETKSTSLPKLASASDLVVEEKIASSKEGVESEEQTPQVIPVPTPLNTANNYSETPRTNQTQAQQRSTKSIAAGTSVKGVFATALFGETTRSANNENKNDNVSVIRLKQPLKNVDGSLALPAGTELLAQIRSISESGMLYLNVVSVIRQDNGKLMETALPESAIKIRAPKGRPLIANKYPNKGRAIARMDTGIFALGGIAKVAELSNRVDSQVITSIGGNIVSQNNPKTNILTGVLEGGLNSIVPQITARNQQAISEMTARSNIWFIQAGTEVEVFVNQLIQL